MKTEQHAEARIKNFTPLLDELVQKYGIVTAAVWGRVWRYAQQENHVCQASHEKIATELSLSTRTVIRHLQVLCEGGYLFDHTPGLKNVPHTYSITPKARILITVEGVTESHTSMTESHSKKPVGVTESPTGCDNLSHEETIKETISSSKKKEVLRIDVTVGGRKLLELLEPECKAAGHRLPVYFGSVAMRDEWVKAETNLAPKELEAAIGKALKTGITSLSRITAYIAKWDTKPRAAYDANGRGQPAAAQRPAVHQGTDKGLDL